MYLHDRRALPLETVVGEDLGLHRARHTPGEAGGIAVRKDDYSAGPGGDLVHELAEVERKRAAVIDDQQHDAIVEAGVRCHGPGQRPRHDPRLAGDLGPIGPAADEAHIHAEPEAGSLAAGGELHARSCRVGHPVGDSPALLVGAVVTRGPKPESAKLAHHIRRGALEAGARRVATHHRIIGDDLDATAHFVCGDVVA